MDFVNVTFRKTYVTGSLGSTKLKRTNYLMLTGGCDSQEFRIKLIILLYYVSSLENGLAILNISNLRQKKNQFI